MDAGLKGREGAEGGEGELDETDVGGGTEERGEEGGGLAARRGRVLAILDDGSGWGESRGSGREVTTRNATERM